MCFKGVGTKSCWKRARFIWSSIVPVTLLVVCFHGLLVCVSLILIVSMVTDYVLHLCLVWLFWCFYLELLVIVSVRSCAESVCGWWMLLIWAHVLPRSYLRSVWRVSVTAGAAAAVGVQRKGRVASTVSHHILPDAVSSCSVSAALLFTDGCRGVCGCNINFGKYQQSEEGRFCLW